MGVKKIIKKNQLIYNKIVKVKLMMRNFLKRDIIKKQSEEFIKVLNKVDINGKNIYYCGVPMHKNMGDQAQRYCIDIWCKENYPDYNIIHLASWPFYSKKFCKEFINKVKKEDIFVIQSGYCTTNKHFDHRMHRFVVKTFVDNKILIMPQTVNFSDESEARKTGKIYNKNNNLLFLARDKISYQSAQNYFNKTKILLYPDIVTSLIGTKKIESGRDGILLCVRNDGEKKYTKEQIDSLRTRIQNNNIKCDINDTNSSLEVHELIKHFEEEFNKTLKTFASYKVVITDRYHGTIFSMIANTPVIILETNDHKVKTGSEWFKGIYDGAFYNANSLEDAYYTAMDILSKNLKIENSAYFKEEYYNKLKRKFENMKEVEENE